MLGMEEQEAAAAATLDDDEEGLERALGVGVRSGNRRATTIANDCESHLSPPGSDLKVAVV